MVQHDVCLVLPVTACHSSVVKLTHQRPNKYLCECEDGARADLASERICYIYCTDRRSWIGRRAACTPYVPTKTYNKSHKTKYNFVIKHQQTDISWTIT